jgi:hypothetical protein
VDGKARDILSITSRLIIIKPVAKWRTSARFFSILRIVFSKKNIKDRVQRDFLEKKNYKKINQFKKYLLTKNIYYPSSGVIFFSDKTTFANLKEITLSFKQAAYKILKKI